MKFAVTGAAGHLGRLAVQGLLEAQPAENIIALVRDAAKAADLAAPVGAAAGAGVATRKLLIGPPYSFCRNPMALGAIVLYGGVSVVAGSLGAALLVILGAAPRC